jgi:thiol-disulfide isomerase/thioredoxin
MIYSVNTDNFILRLPSKELVFKDGQPLNQYMLLCTASWCPHCRRLLQVINQIDLQLGGRFTFLQAEQTDVRTGALMKELGVEGYPSMYFIEPDGVVDRTGFRGDRTVSGITTALLERGAL